MNELLRIESKLKGKLWDAKSVDKAFIGAIDKALTECLVILESAVKEKTPVGVSGQLRGSIQSELRGSATSRRGVVFSNMVYAPPVELGRKAAPVPIAPLQLWVWRKRDYFPGTEKYPAIETVADARRVAFAISAKKAKNLTKGRFMFTRAFEENKERILPILNGIIDEIAGELNV